MELSATATGLGDKFAVLYQLRHSGASWDRFKEYRTLLEVKQRGRWASDNSLKRYEQHAMVAQQFEKLNPALKRRAQAAPATLQAMVLAQCPEQVKIQKPFLELFAGCGTCVALGIPAEAWDIEYGRSCNVLNPVVARRLLARIRDREFSAVHLGMPCAKWSMARRHDRRGPEPLRSDTCLNGLPNLNPADNKKVCEGNQLLAFSITVIDLCNQLGIPWT